MKRFCPITDIMPQPGPKYGQGAPVAPDGSTAARDVLAERRRQVEAEGWTPEHDDTHDQGEIALAAACYLTGRADLWPWLGSPKFKDRRTDLVRGVALGHAEIERLDRTTLSTEPGAGAASALPSPLPSQNGADAIVAEIEKRFPNWRSFRDLVDCIDCTLHDLRGAAR